MNGDAFDCVGAASVPRTNDSIDRAMLERAIELAELGRPGARPNPVVGAVLALPDGAVIGTGHHVRKGAAHAERALLDDLTHPVPEHATLYVSLEPCSHHGSTPPCTDAIIEHGVRRVVYASSDANTVTAGIGPAKLRAAGIDVARAPIDIERRALQQNAGFHSVHLRGRAYLTAKWAMTRNGRFATGDPNRRWISGETSREHVQYLRAGSGAVLVGIGTVLADDPLLTVRGVLVDRTPVPPTRIVFDRRLRTPLDSQLVRTIDAAPVLVVCAHDAPLDPQLALEAAGAEVWRAPECGPGDPCIGGWTLARLAEHGINDVLCESGPTLLAGFHDAELLDAFHAFVAPFDAPEDQPGLELDHPLAQLALSSPAHASGEDAHHHAILHPAWAFPGATAD